MRFFQSAFLGFLATQFVQVLAEDAEPVKREIPIFNVADELSGGGAAEQKPIAVTGTASFPDSEVFGVKLVNGKPTTAVITINNGEKEPVNVLMIGGSLANPATQQVVRNLTITQYGVEVPAGESTDLTYAFATEMHPQDLQLSISGVLTSGGTNFYTLSIHNGTVSIVEAPISIFDPQIMFLYVFLTGLFAATCYFIYNTWVAPLFPKKPTPRMRKPEVVVPAATTTGAQGYDESWIPTHHTTRPEPRKTKSSSKKRA